MQQSVPTSIQTLSAGLTTEASGVLGEARRAVASEPSVGDTWEALEAVPSLKFLKPEGI